MRTITNRLRALGTAALFVTGCVGVSPAQDAAPKHVRHFPTYLSGDEARTAALYRDVSPTVVTIFTSRALLERGGSETQEGIGSGVLISAENHVLTAAHVVEGAEQILVKTHDGKAHAAQLLFSESTADIALLRFLEPDPSLPHARLGDSDRLAVGQYAYAIGSPYGLEESFSVGHISGFREFDRLYDGTIRAEFIQTDAAINTGNSGGPLFNSNGEVIGIASRIVTTSGGSQGLGFVVTINTAKELLALEDRVWLGIEGVFLSREVIADLLNRDLEGGLLVVRVAKGSPADRAGLRGGTVPVRIFGKSFVLGGDLIVEFAAQETCHAECLIQAKSKLSGLDRIPVKYLRGGKLEETVIDVSGSRRSFLHE